jgi:glucose-1-phosphate adenylyltransferase
MQMRVLAFVLAGGKGTRLYPLTKERAKPAVPFGGRYRIIDFVLSNLVNSGIYSIYVLVQFKSQSLLQHLREGWEAGGLLRNHFIIPVPAQMRTPGEDWYRGTADAIYQNINLIEQAEPPFSGDLRRRSYLPHEYSRNDRVSRAEAGAGDHLGDSRRKEGSQRIRRN